MRTAALLSKRMTLPSGRRTGNEVRTITAFITWPFFTRPFGMASFTLTTITSPIVAVRRMEPPRTLMHMTRRAPELSATSRLVCICIIAVHLSGEGAQAHPAFISLGQCLAGNLVQNHPTFVLRNRRTFLDANDVALVKRIRFIVRVVFFCKTHSLFQNRV